MVDARRSRRQARKITAPAERGLQHFTDLAICCKAVANEAHSALQNPGSVLQKLPTKTILLDVLNLSDMTVEAPQTVAARIHGTLPHVSPGRTVVAPDCGLKSLPREVAFQKMQSHGRRGCSESVAAAKVAALQQFP